MTVFRLNSEEHYELTELAAWLGVDRNILLQKMLTNQFQYFIDQKKQFDESGANCVKIEAAEALDL